EDHWEEALNSAEISWEMNPGTPYGAHTLSESLASLGRIKEAAERLSKAAEECESFEVTSTACWYVCALAETTEGEERHRDLATAEHLAKQASARAPLADREAQGSFARARLDIAELKDDHVEMERWSEKVRSPFHRRVLENLRTNRTGLRIRLPFRRKLQ